MSFSYNKQFFNESTTLSLTQSPRDYKKHLEEKKSVNVQQLTKLLTLGKGYNNYLKSYQHLTENHTFHLPNVTSYPIKKNYNYIPIKFTKPEISSSLYDLSNANYTLSHSLFKNRNDKYLNRNINISKFELNEEDQDSYSKILKTESTADKNGKKLKVRSVLGNIPKIRANYNNVKSNFFYDLCNECYNKKRLENNDIPICLTCKNENEIKNNETILNYFIEKVMKLPESKNNTFTKAKNFDIQNIYGKFNFTLTLNSICLDISNDNQNYNKNIKLFLPFDILPLYYLLEINKFKLFISEILVFKDKNISIINEDKLSKVIDKFSKYSINLIKKKDYLNYYKRFYNDDTNHSITLYQNEKKFQLNISWIIQNEGIYKINIQLPVILFNSKEGKIQFKKLLPKRLFYKILKHNFIDWDRITLEEIFMFKVFKNIMKYILSKKAKKYENNIINLDNINNYNNISNIYNLNNMGYNTMTNLGTSLNLNNNQNNINSLNNNLKKYELFVSHFDSKQNNDSNVINKSNSNLCKLSRKNITSLNNANSIGSSKSNNIINDYEQIKYYQIVPHRIKITDNETNEIYNAYLTIRDSQNLLKLKPFWTYENTIKKCICKDIKNGKTYVNFDLINNLNKEYYDYIKPVIHPNSLINESNNNVLINNNSSEQHSSFETKIKYKSKKFNIEITEPYLFIEELYSMKTNVFKDISLKVILNQNILNQFPKFTIDNFDLMIYNNLKEIDYNDILVDEDDECDYDPFIRRHNKRKSSNYVKKNNKPYGSSSNNSSCLKSSKIGVNVKNSSKNVKYKAMLGENNNENNGHH